MKRKTKNTISFIIIILIALSMIFTIYTAKNNISTSNSNQPINNEKLPSSNIQMQEPPEKPDENNNQNSNNMDDSTSQNNENQFGNSQESQPPEMNSNQSQNTLTSPYYIALGIESLLLSIVIIYLIQSKFNKNSIKETYYSSDKLLIGLLSIIIITSALVFGITYEINNHILKNDKMPEQMNNNSNNNVSYTAANEITDSKTISDKKYTSTTKDENVLSVSGNIKATVSDTTVSKTGDSTGADNTSFYGINSAIIAKSGAILNLKNMNVTTNAVGANGVFCYGGSATTNNSTSDGTTINISNSTITTKKDNSGGIMTTGGGTTNASNLTITTSGTSSAAIRTDRGGGTVNVDGGTYKTNGQGSPSIYSTANINVKNAQLTSTTSEGIVIEGKNSVTIENVKLTDSNTKLNGQSTTYKNIFLYQSMSGDADNGTSEFTAKNSTITTNKGDSFYITNTTAKITLTNNKIINNDSTGNFLRAQTDSWGPKGSNGGIVTLLMNNQTATGNIVIDSISTLDMTMTSSSYTGAINKDNKAKSIKLKLDSDSKIKLTGDSYISSLDNADTSNSNIDFNGYKLYVNGTAIN